MVWHCPVPGCDISQERNPSKLSSFGVPSDATRRDEWKRILNCDFKGSVRVCEKHFSSNDIQREYSHKLKDGRVILHGQFKKVLLKKGACPIPPNSGDQRPKIGMINGKEVENVDYVILKEPESKTREFYERENESDNVGKFQEGKSDVPINTKNLSCIDPGAEPEFNREHSSNLDADNLEENEPLIDTNSPILNTPSKYIISAPKKVRFDEISRKDNTQLLKNVDVSSSESADDTYSYKVQEEPYSLMRKNIMRGAVNVTLPDTQSWAIVRNDKSDSLLFMYGEVLEPTHPRNELTLSSKIVALTKTKVVTWFSGKNIKLKIDEKPGTLKELEGILQLVHSYTICSGGPPTRYASNAKLKAAYKDKTVWRHNNCDLVLQGGKTCIHCIRIHRLLSEYIRRRVAKEISGKFGNLIPRKRGAKSKLRQKNCGKTKIIRKQDK